VLDPRAPVSTECEASARGIPASVTAVTDAR
jgi:hypothetical protein